MTAIGLCACLALSFRGYLYAQEASQAELFVWTPPERWQQWEMPSPEGALLKPGTGAPDFELAAVDGSKIKLSDFRDKIVWFCIWRAG